MDVSGLTFQSFFPLSNFGGKSQTKLSGCVEISAPFLANEYLNRPFAEMADFSGVRVEDLFFNHVPKVSVGNSIFIKSLNWSEVWTGPISLNP